ncbi:MAG: hypothetical protein IJP54_08955, partial [Synergistaceae bacterium]|nr:hypothetical protein [Synergistaceae bacterium]
RLIARAVSEEQGDDGSHFLSSKYLNANGDLTSNTYEKRVYAKPRIPLRWFFRSSAFPGKWMQQIIANFAEYCSGLNVRIYATWPPVYSPTDKKEFYGRDAEIIEAIKRFWAELNIPMIGDYRDVFMEPEDCFTDYIHINWRGKQKYTKHLIELIRPYI